MISSPTELSYFRKPVIANDSAINRYWLQQTYVSID